MNKDEQKVLDLTVGERQNLCHVLSRRKKGLSEAPLRKGVAILEQSVMRGH